MTRNQFSGFRNLIFKGYNKLPGFIKKPATKALNKHRTKNMEKEGLTNMIFYVTDRCNARCKHCFYWKNLNRKTEELELDKIKKIAESIKKPLDLLVITGGEPFVRDDIKEICDIFYRTNKTKRISIDTNGMLTDKIIRNVEGILENPKKLTVFLSLDGMQETHDKMRGVKGAFASMEKTINGLKKLEKKYKNLTIMLATTLTKENFGELNKVREYANKTDVLHKINIARSNSMVFNIDKNLLNDFDPEEKNELSIEELEKVYEMINEKKDLGSRIESMKLRHSIDMVRAGKRKVRCLATYNNIVVFPNGNVSVCEPTKPFANLKNYNYDIDKAFNSKEAETQKQKLKECFCLQPCNLLDAMRYDTETLINL